MTKVIPISECGSGYFSISSDAFRKTQYSVPAASSLVPSKAHNDRRTSNRSNDETWDETGTCCTSFSMTILSFTCSIFIAKMSEHVGNMNIVISGAFGSFQCLTCLRPGVDISNQCLEKSLLLVSFGVCVPISLITLSLNHTNLGNSINLLLRIPRKS
jgi:hypothetical protein